MPSIPPQSSPPLTPSRTSPSPPSTPSRTSPMSSTRLVPFTGGNVTETREGDEGERGAAATPVRRQ
ncbi:hypothetical protein Trydic_g12027, partial [Trypoxylus dichotomus]